MINLNLTMGFVLFIIIIAMYNTGKKLKKSSKKDIKMPSSIALCVKNIKNIKTLPIIKKVVVDKNDMAYYSELSQRINREEQIKYNLQPIDSSEAALLGARLNEPQEQLQQDPDEPVTELVIPDNNRLDILEDIRNYDNGNMLELIGNFTAKQQNVHDSLIQDNIKLKSEKIKGTNAASTTEILYQKEIIDYAQRKHNGGKIYDILMQIKNRNSHITNINSTEVQVLNDSWAAANENVKVQIINELLDSVVNGYIVCPTGVVSRILSADIVEDPESGPRTQEILRVEMLATASQVRADLEADNHYMQLNDIEQTVMLKDALKKKYIENYTGVVSMERVEAELESWYL